MNFIEQLVRITQQCKMTVKNKNKPRMKVLYHNVEGGAPNLGPLVWSRVEPL